MSEVLKYSLFYDALFPDVQHHDDLNDQDQLRLQKFIRYNIDPDIDALAHTLVIFDFETTGLDSNEDFIIEIGAQKYQKFKLVEEFSALIKPPIEISSQIEKLTGLTSEMLKDKPLIAEVLPSFLKFIEGGILIAHNAEFDMAFLKSACRRIGYELEWPCFCTLKLARKVLPQLESRNLDLLAEYYDLSFESRHRSIGDVKVTGKVLENMLENEGTGLRLWRDFEDFRVL